MKESNAISLSKQYGVYNPFRTIFRDYTKEGEAGFLRGYLLWVDVTFAVDESEMSKKGLREFTDHNTEWVDQYLNELFNNTVLVSSKDPLANIIVILERESLIDVRVMENTTLKGLAAMLLEDFSLTLKEQTNGLVRLTDVVVEEKFA